MNLPKTTASFKLKYDENTGEENTFCNTTKKLNTGENQKKRSVKTTAWQFELFVKELENNEAFQNAYFSAGPKDKLWKKLVGKLNTCGGPQRGLADWKRVFCNWKSQIKKKSKLITKKITTRKSSDHEKMMDLEERFLRIISTSGNEVSIMEANDSIIIIENSDFVEFINEEGATISNIDKMKISCDGTTTIIRTEQQYPSAPDSGFETSSYTFSNNDENTEIVTELKGIRIVLEKHLKELQVQNKINILRARIDYEKAKSKYKNFNLEFEV